jgi:hypothetical protein
VNVFLLYSDLWSTFYELVDDTSQIAKAHSILSESIGNQVVGPFEESIKSMDMNRRKTLDEANSISGEVNEAFSILRKATQQLEDTTNEVNATRLGLSRVEGAITVKPRELDRARLKYQTASEKLSIARSSYRQCDDVCRSLQSKVQLVDIPRISRMLSGLEAARGSEVRQILQASTHLDRQAAEMHVQCAAMMESKVNSIVLDDALDSLMAIGVVGVNGGMSTGNGNNNTIANNNNSSNNEESRRYSISRPIMSRAPLQDGTTPRTLEACNPSPSYYPSNNTNPNSSVDALERKTNASQAIIH